MLLRRLIDLIALGNEMEGSYLTQAASLRMFTSPYRRRGATWFESRVIVATSQDSASSELNCSTLLDNSSDTLLQGAGDFCHLRQEVVFPVGVVMQEVTIRLLDDDIAEGEEIFFVQLLEEEGLTNAILHGNVRSKVTITDMEDCK